MCLQDNCPPGTTSKPGCWDHEAQRSSLDPFPAAEVGAGGDLAMAMKCPGLEVTHVTSIHSPFAKIPWLHLSGKALCSALLLGGKNQLG